MWQVAEGTLELIRTASFYKPSGVSFSLYETRIAVGDTSNNAIRIAVVSAKAVSINQSENACQEEIRLHAPCSRRLCRSCCSLT